MRFDFDKNVFTDTENLSPKPFIIGTDRILCEQEVFNIFQKLTNALIELQIPAGHPVIIFGEKEALFPVAMISLISLNVPYIPVDAIMPEGRIRKIKELSGSKVMINCSAAKCKVEFEVQINSDLEVIRNQSKGNYPVISSDPGDFLRYILFTSGSTGEPKGVQITASALNSFAGWFKTWDGISEQSVFMNQAPFSFDISLCDFIGAFLCGSTLVLNNYEILKNGNVFLKRFSEYKGNTIVCTPSFMTMYLTIPEFRSENYPELQQIIFIGEELLPVTAKKLRKVFPDIEIVNAYGPTEATVVTTYIKITEDILQQFPKSLPIGYNRPDGEILILNENNDSSEMGEIVIVGDHVSTGYLNNKEKNDLAFYQYNGKRAYKTGDFGFIKNDIIFFQGRKDEQIKLNGYRIELEEISNQLVRHPDVINAAVIPLISGTSVKKIISFVILKPELKSGDHNVMLKEYLSSLLPSYMIPSEFVLLDEFPLNSNYKVDKKVLLNVYMNGE